MRHTEFRGKDLVYGQWHYGDLAHVEMFRTYKKKTYIVSHRAYGGWLNVTNRHQVDEETVGQSTGLLDKTGTVIYEGDIVKTKNGRICHIHWNSLPGFCGWDLTPLPPSKQYPKNYDDSTRPSEYDLYESFNLTIIGNIWDNPELLKQL